MSTKELLKKEWTYHS